MRLTVIGCWGGSPRPGGACSGYLLEDGDDVLLLDCGPGVAGAVQHVRPLEAIDHVFVSHFHYDHVTDAGAIMYARLVRRIIGEPLGDVVFYATAKDPLVSALAMDGAAHSVEIDEGKPLKIGRLTCTFLRTDHPVPCLAVRVENEEGESVVYTADGALTDRLVAFCAGADVLVAECSLYAGVDGSVMGHMSCDDVARLAAGARPGTLVLSHLPIYGETSELRDRVVELLPPGAVGRVVLAGQPCTAEGRLSIEVSRAD